MISINSVEHAVNGSNNYNVRHNISLTIFPNENTKWLHYTTNQLILNELLLTEYGFGIDEIKKYFPEHFI